jgi:hypothetical protein
MQITAPSQDDCGNVSAYFLGNYSTYGLLEDMSNTLVNFFRIFLKHE